MIPVLITELPGVSLAVLEVEGYHLYWRKYDAAIEDARKEVLRRLDDFDGTTQELEEYREYKVEREIDTSKLSNSDFEWHSCRICWGCGKPHVQQPKMYTYTREKTENWKDGIYNKSRTYSISANIPLCPEYYNRLMEEKKLDERTVSTILFPM